MGLELKDCIREINSISNEFMELIHYIDKDNYEQIKLLVNENVNHLTDIEKPKIMMCGIYDAGKSTLINAIMKNEVAPVSDRPETFRIDEYDNGTYILVDSPGVDAPIEHEKITNEYLNKCHIIFFVVSTKGTFESQTNYKYMYDFIKSEIPFVIILNDKDGIMEKDTNEIIRIKHKIIENLKKISKNPNIDKKYQIIVVNAKRAFKGAVENKKNMYKKSNITLVENKINEVIQKDNALDMLLVPIKNMNSIIDEAERREISKLNKFSDKNYDKYIESLNKKRDNVLNEICADIRGNVNSKKEMLINKCIEQGSLNPNEIMDSIIDQVSKTSDRKLESLSRYIEKNFKELGIEVDKKCNIFSNISVLGIDVESNNDFNHKKGNIKNSFSNIECVISNDNSISKSISSNTKKGLPYLIEKINEFLNKDEIKYKKYEEEAEIKNQAEINRVNELIRIRQDVRVEVESALYNLSTDLVNEVTNEFIRKFDGIINHLTMCADINDEEKEFIENNLCKLRDLRKKLNIVKNQIV